MNLRSIRNGQRAQGFALMDALFAMAIAGIMFAALFSGLAFGFKVIRMARENTRATQVMLEKMETIRLYTWTQITTPGFLPTNTFTVPYYAVGGTNNSLMYTGRLSVLPSGLGTSYADEMRKIEVTVDWGSLGNGSRTRTMSTYVSKNGMQTYVY
jgi:type II secretory pathway pseudopilin PulG